MVRFGLIPLISAVLVLAAAPYLLPLTMPDIKPGPAAVRGGARDGVPGFGLQDVIQGVRRDLMAAQTRLIQERELPMFQVESFDIELSFIVKQSTAVDAKAGAPEFIVVSGRTDLGQEQVQKIQLHLSVPKPPEPDVRIHQTPPKLEGLTRVQ
jgi:hypothetical protein